MAYDADGTGFLGCAYTAICEFTGPLFVDAVTCSFHDPEGWTTGFWPALGHDFVITDLGCTCSITGPWGTYLGSASAIDETQANPSIPTPGIWTGTSRTNWSTVGYGQAGSPTPGETAENAVLTVLAPGMLLSAAGELDLNFPVDVNDPLVGSAGTAPYTYELTCGALPGGLTLDGATGIMSGEITVTGSFPLCFRVTDVYGFTGTSNGVLVVAVNSPQWILHRFDMKPRAEERA